MPGASRASAKSKPKLISLIFQSSLRCIYGTYAKLYREKISSIPISFKRGKLIITCMAGATLRISVAHKRHLQLQTGLSRGW